MTRKRRPGVVRRLLGHWSGLFGLILIAIFLFAGLFAPLIAPYLGIETAERYAESSLPPARRKQLMLEAYAERQRLMAAATPLLFVVEDAHWIDPTSLELLDLHVAYASYARVLIALTFRPEF